MATVTEVERKFDAPAGFAIPDLSAVCGVTSVDDPVEFDLDAIYYDTTDLALARHATTLRRRSGGHDAGWHLKRPQGADRSELQVPATEADQAASDHDPAVPDRIVSEVWVHTRGSALQPVARIRTRRAERAVRDAGGRTLALIATDDVASESYDPDAAAPIRQRWHELETELVEGDRDLLAAVADALCVAGATPAHTPSKFAHALGARYPSANPNAAASEAENRTPDAGETNPKGQRMAPAIASYLRDQRDAIAHNDPLVRAGDSDGVHDMRVAIRRVRATLRTFRTAFARQRTEPLRAELQWLGHLLGAVRDNDVLRWRIDDAIAAEPADAMVGPVAARIQERLAAERAAATLALAEVMTSRRYATMLDDLDSVVDGAAPNAGDARLRRAARRALTRADAALDRSAQLPAVPVGVALPSSHPRDRDAGLHESRKAYKRARYATEALAPVAGRRARRLAKRISTLQDLLGIHQDAVVAARVVRDYGMRAHLDGDNAYTYGLLHARQVEAGRRALRGLNRARRRAGKRSVRSWLE
jgi:CHAD domain-containing protein